MASRSGRAFAPGPTGIKASVARPRLPGGASCGLVCRVVELNAHGPRYAVANVDSYVHHACGVMAYHLAQKVEESTAIEAPLMIHNPLHGLFRSYGGESRAGWRI